MNNHHLKLTVLLILTALISPIQAQYWLQTYGEFDTTDYDVRITKSPYVGFFAGRTYNSHPTDISSRVWLVDTFGNQIWENDLGGDQRSLNDVFYAHNYGFVDYWACGTEEDAGVEVAWLSGFDGTGVELFTNYYPLVPFKRIADDDSITMYLMGENYSSTHVYSIDEYGADTNWHKEYDYGIKTQAEEIFGTGIGEGFVFFASVIETSSTPQEMCAVRCDVNGDTIWKTCSYKEDLTELADGVAAADGGFIMAGACIGGPNQGIQLTKMDQNGNIVYDKLYFISDYDIPIAIDETPDGGVMMVSAHGSFTGIRYLIRFDAAGDTLWRRAWDETNGFPTDLLTYGYEPVLAGEYEEFIPGFPITTDAFIARANVDGILPICLIPGDCVWPGDTDYDGIANNFDLLPIGIAYGETGPFRAGGLAWMPQPATDWVGALTSGVNYKHIDTDGNEIVEDADTLAIHVNYGLTHSRPSATAGGGIPLFLVASADTASAGDTIQVEVHLGMDTLPAELIYGLAFTVNYDATAVDESTISVNYDGWLGDKGLDMITLDYRLESGILPMALTRIDGSEVTGDGTIATIQYVLDDDLGGKLSEEYLTALFSITDVKVIRLDQTEQDVAIGNTEVVIGYIPNGLENPLVQALEFYPNPSTGVINFISPENATLSIFDALGSLVLTTQVYQGSNEVDLRTISKGVYVLKIKSFGIEQTAKLIKQ
ncbi:MAG: hypothetical protein ACI959_000337 [Limisphaerales bacterium]|jgi:hypothetical protein